MAFVPVLLAASTQTVRGVAADGTTQVVVRFPDGAGQAGDMVKFSLYNDNARPAPSNSPDEDGYLSSLDGTVTKVNTINTTAVQPAGSPSPMAFAIYHAPIDFVRSGNPNDPGATQRAVSIQVQVQNQDAGGGPVQIVRPPVALIHGIWSDRTTWDFFAPLVLPNEQYDPRFQVFRIDYRNHHADHVDAIVKSDDESPFDQFSSYLSQFKTQLNVAAVQFDIVVHSMGGLVTRDMALDPRFKEVRNYNQGIVHKLITIGSPHNGSLLVNELNSTDSVCKAIFGKIGKSIAGAVDDLTVGSLFLANVNGIITLPLKAHAIVGVANSGQESASEFGFGTIHLLGLCRNVLVTTYQGLFGEGSDLIVPEDSQRFGFSPPSTSETNSGAIHTVASLVFPDGPDELNRILKPPNSNALNPVASTDPTIDPNRVINGLNTPVSDSTYWADINP